MISLFSILILLIPTSGASSEVINISPEKLQVEENDTFTLEILIASDASVSGFQLQLSSDMIWK